MHEREHHADRFSDRQGNLAAAVPALLGDRVFLNGCHHRNLPHTFRRASIAVAAVWIGRNPAGGDHRCHTAWLLSQWGRHCNTQFGDGLHEHRATCVSAQSVNLAFVTGTLNTWRSTLAVERGPLPEAQGSRDTHTPGFPPNGRMSFLPHRCAFGGSSDIALWRRVKYVHATAGWNNRRLETDNTSGRTPCLVMANRGRDDNVCVIVCYAEFAI
jgi:hypothetical protein